MRFFSRILFFLLFFTVDHSTAKKIKIPTSNCSSSSCGSIRNIRFPFRLKSDPRSCGYEYPQLELDCERNQTIFNIGPTKYYVQEINYSDWWIRLVDPGIKRGHLSSCPVNPDEYIDWESISVFPTYRNEPVAFIHCLAPVTSLKYVKASFCGDRSSISSGIHSYVTAGATYFWLSDLEDSCTLDRFVYAFAQGPNWDTSSLASIYDGLAHGFELDWSRVLCKGCGGGEECNLLDLNTISCIDLCGETQFLRKVLNCRFRVYRGLAYSYCGIAIVSLLGLRFVCGFPFLVGLVVSKWRRRHLSVDESIEEFLQGQNNLTPIKYTYSEIKKMTHNFNQRLGEGGFGTVYKGKLRSGPFVAVKMMGQSLASTEQEFISEVGTIGRIHHVNVVQLIGFCVEGSKCALVYEYLPNGSLDRYIFSQQSLDVLALRYDKMFEIALGVARGIDYLHRGCDMQILHFDIKPHNILLDENFNPKISDFGLAKLYPTDGSIVNITAARGTMGYMAPEMFYKNIGGVSYKADVYSFGMLLMEIAGRRKNMNPFAEDVSQIYFPSWVYDQLCAGKEIQVEDATGEERKTIKKIIIVALWCIQMKPSDRPSMNKTVEMLEGDNELLMPPKPFMGPREIAEGHGVTN